LGAGFVLPSFLVLAQKEGMGEWGGCCVYELACLVAGLIRQAMHKT